MEPSGGSRGTCTLLFGSTIRYVAIYILDPLAGTHGADPIFLGFDDLAVLGLVPHKQVAVFYFTIVIF